MSKSFIYVIGPDDKKELKVGHSTNPERRLKTFNTGRADELFLHFQSDEFDSQNAFIVEKIIHKHISPYKIKREWFNIPFEDLISQIEIDMMKYAYDEQLPILYRNHVLRY